MVKALKTEAWGAAGIAVIPLHYFKSS